MQFSNPEYVQNEVNNNVQFVSTKGIKTTQHSLELIKEGVYKVSEVVTNKLKEYSTDPSKPFIDIDSFKTRYTEKEVEEYRVEFLIKKLNPGERYVTEIHGEDYNGNIVAFAIHLIQNNSYFSSFRTCDEIVAKLCQIFQVKLSHSDCGGFETFVPFENVETWIGQTLKDVQIKDDDEVMEFHFNNGLIATHLHNQNCCESVSIEDIVGDIKDLIGTPLLKAEESSSSDISENNKLEDESESATWTFYKFATIKGTVDVRWMGSSNGYYSESVNCEVKATDDLIQAMFFN